MQERLKRFVPGPLWAAVRWLYYFPLDTYDRLSGRRDALMPPRSLMFVGGGNFVRSGQRFKSFFVELGGLKPHDRVLDVGCGVGRMAVPLTTYLDGKGKYEGFDVVVGAIRWCEQAITSRFPNFHFVVADLYNKTYNPRGRYEAKDYPFPYEDASFDFAILTSVFTHLLPEDTEHYVAELSRVMAPGGRVFATHFLLNEESRKLMAAGQADRVFTHERPGCFVANPDVPEDAVAYDESIVRDRLARHGFRVSDPIHFGKWCGRAAFTSYQDIVIAVRD